ncbi:unnamed protein product, partial [Mesorhabditis spiculigera]
MYAGEDCPKVDPVPIDPPKRPAPSYTFCSEIQPGSKRTSSHTEPLSSVATVRHGNLMATASYDGLVRLWDTTSLKLANTLKPVDDDKWPVSFVRFSPNGKFVLAGYHNSKIRLWDVNNGKALRIYEGHQQSKYCTPTHFAITGGKYIISGSEDGDVVAWDMQDTSILQRWRAHESCLIASDCHPRTNLLVTAALDDDYSIKRWTSPQ